MSGCPNTVLFTRAQEEYMLRAIDEHKWYLSERAGYDVGFLWAVQDFTDKHLPQVAAEFRSYFCLGRCHTRAECQLSRRVPEMNAGWADREPTA